MDVLEGYRIAHKILKLTDGRRDMDLAARLLGIEVHDEFDLVHLKGMYSAKNKHRTIFLHCRLSEYLRRFVLAHEIGHDQIPEHRELAKGTPFQDSSFSCFKDTKERDATSIAAHLLIDDEEMIERLKMYHDTMKAAAALKVPEDFLLIEMEDYKKLHPEYSYLLNLPRSGRGDFLKDYDDGTFNDGEGIPCYEEC